MPQNEPPTIADTQLGLSGEEIQVLRAGQAALAGNNSSRGASRASSQGLLLLDATSLAALGRYFDRLMASIQEQVAYLSDQAEMFTSAQFDNAGMLVEGADAEIERYYALLRQLDELEHDFDRIANIKQIVKAQKTQLEALEEMDRDLDRDLDKATNAAAAAAGSRRDNREGHKHSSSHKHAHRHKR